MKALRVCRANSLHPVLRHRYRCRLPGADRIPAPFGSPQAAGRWDRNDRVGEQSRHVREHRHSVWFLACERLVV